jgi:O6-methylguanine-DNA--protein-cysteine methyltransferase
MKSIVQTTSRMTKRSPIGPLSRLARCCGLGLLLLTIGGCFMGMYFPTSIDTELAVKAPLRGSAAQIQTIAIALPSNLEEHFNLADASRGKLDRVGLDLGERLHKSGRLTIVSPTQYQAALADQRRAAYGQRGRAISDRERTEAIVNAAKSVKADGVLLLDGSWESANNLGTVSFGRPEFRRLLTLSLIAVPSGETVWYQEATAVIREGLAVPQEPAVREAIAADVADNLLQTLR